LRLDRLWMDSLHASSFSHSDRYKKKGQPQNTGRTSRCALLGGPMLTNETLHLTSVHLNDVPEFLTVLEENPDV
jgi:hypothetical protein